MFDKNRKVKIVGDNANTKELNDNKFKKSLIVAACAVTVAGIGLYGYQQLAPQQILTKTELKEYQNAKKAYEDAGIKNFDEKDFKKQKEKEPLASLNKDGEVKAVEAEPKELKEDDDDGKIDIGSGVEIDPFDYDPVEISKNIDNSKAGINQRGDSNLALINYSNPEANITNEKVAAAILKDLSLYNQSIDSNVGWPESKYDPSLYEKSQKYIQTIVNYPKTGKKPSYNIYTFGYDEQVAQVRYSIFHNLQLEMYEGNQGYSKILKRFLETRPKISSIESVYVKYRGDLDFDGTNANIQAIIIAGGKSYTAYLSIDPSEDNSLRLLDIGGN